jgi:DNA polymerase-3 subunit gamma/tau
MSSYLVLARKYRSSTFDEVVGQEAISQTLVNAIKTGRIHHAYLFTGTRGVGKTTMARILAKALNCLSAEGPTPEPCNECDACVSIARGDDMDVIEIDGASNRGIEEIRELRANAIFRPARCRYKVYYIDEVHMLTREAFNALLKTLEEPPGHVKFVFSTTEVEKVPATIVSRCQRFDFRDIPTRLIAEHLKKLCEAEKVEADDDALFRIARAAAGSMRDGLSLLDQLLAGGARVSDADVIRILGTPPDERMLAIVGAIADGSAAGALGELNGVLASGVSLASAAAALGEAFRNMMIASSCGGDSELIELPETQRKAVVELAGRFSTPALVQAVGICQTVGRSLRGSSVARGLVEAAVVRLAEAEKFIDPASLVERLEALSGRGTPAPVPTGQKKKPIAIGRPPQPAGTADRAAPPTPGPVGAPAPRAVAGRRAPPAGAGQEAPSELPNPAPTPPRAAPSLSTAERARITKDPAVQAVTAMFGGQIEDMRVEAAAFEPAEADNGEPNANGDSGSDEQNGAP